MLCSVSQFALSQIKLSGIVLDSATREPMTNAFMTLGAHKLIADANGNFSVTQLTAGSYTLNIIHIGCHPLSLRLFLVNDTFITIFLPHHLHAFEEIINKICTYDSDDSMDIIYYKGEIDYLLEKCKLLEYTLDNQYFTNLVSDLETNIESNTESIYIYDILHSLKLFFQK